MLAGQGGGLGVADEPGALVVPGGAGLVAAASPASARRLRAGAGRRGGARFLGRSAGSCRDRGRGLIWARAGRLARALPDSDPAAVAAVLRLSRSRRWLAPLALAVGAFAMLLEGLKLLFTNWRLTLIQVLPAMWIWAAMLDLKAHLLHGRSFHVLTGPQRGEDSERERQPHRRALPSRRRGSRPFPATDRVARSGPDPGLASTPDLKRS